MDWTPPDWLLNSTIILALLTFLGLIVRMIGPWRKQISEAEDRLRKDLIAERARCEAELSIVRHRERGSRHIIYSMLHIFDLPHGERREGALANVHATLHAMERREAEEAGLLISAPSMAMQEVQGEPE